MIDEREEEPVRQSDLEPITISSKRRLGLPNFSEVPDLIYMVFVLTWKDTLIQYRQSILGFLWGFIKPFGQMLAFSMLFGLIAKSITPNVPYPIFVFSGLFPWIFFSQATTLSSFSFINGSGLFAKTRFPKIILPIASVLTAGIDFLMQFGVLSLMLVYYSIKPSVNLAYLPLFVAPMILMGLGIGLVMGTLNVKYRDIGHALPMLLQFWMFASPVVYSEELIVPAWRDLYNLNPMTPIIIGIRWCILGTGTLEFYPLLYSGIVCVVVFFIGLTVYQRYNDDFLDYLTT